MCIRDRLCSYNQGLVLINGETGSGKSTTLASLLDRINHTKPVHILTLEDPVEYIYTPDQSRINQREIGRDTMSFAAGLRDVYKRQGRISPASPLGRPSSFLVFFKKAEKAWGMVI